MTTGGSPWATGDLGGERWAPGGLRPRAWSYSEGAQRCLMATLDIPPPGSHRRRFGVFELDLRTGELTRGGRPVKLQPQPARVLAYLVSRAGDVVLREELQAHLWGTDTFVDFERGLNFCILQVRTALGDQSDNPRFIQTVTRKGYRFIAPVVDAPALPLERSSPPAVSSTQPEVPPPRASALGEAAVRRSAVTRAIAFAGVLVAATTLVLLALMRSDAPPAGGRVRLAVLPVLNLTGEADADYLADGLTDELIAQLGRISPEHLGVISRTSAMTYRGTGKTVAEIGGELDVAYVLESTLRREGPRLRVTAELVDTGDQTQVWADTFERTAVDLVSLQAEIGVRVARALALTLAPGGASPGLPPPTRDAEAWDLYLRGRHWLVRGTPDDLVQALGSFEQAVGRDPKFAGGWAALAETRHVQVMMGSVAPLDAYPRASEEASRALALDDTLADAHVAKGLVELWFDWSPAAAARSFSRALALNASHGAAHHDYGWALVGLGRFDEAVAEITAARDLDPLSVRANTDIGWMRLHLRQPTEAARACRQTLALQPSSPEAQACLERAFLQRGLLAEALNAARATLPADTDVTTAAPVSSPADELRAIWQWRLDRLEARAATRWASPYTRATYLLSLDRPDAAVARLEEAYDARVGAMAFLATDPAMDRLRGDARFEALVARVRSSTR